MYREAKNFLMNQLDYRTSEAGEKVLTTAGHLKTIADQLRADELTSGAASLADRGAEALERVGHYLDKSDGDRLLGDAERFGRERPWVLAGAGLALGLAGSRMLKASGARRDSLDYDSSYGSGSSYAGSTRFTGSGNYGASQTSSGSSVADLDTPVSSDAAPMTAASQGAAGMSPSSTRSSRAKGNDGS